MKLRILCLVLALLIPLSCRLNSDGFALSEDETTPPVPSPEPSSLSGATALALKGVSIFDGVSPARSGPHTVLIDQDRITGIQPPTEPVPAGYEVMDFSAEDVTLLPGLIDLHTHFPGSGSWYGDQYFFDPKVNLLAYMYYGVTTLVDLHSAPNLMTELKRGGHPGVFPDVYFAGPLFSTEGGHGTQFNAGGLTVRKINTPGDASREWQAHQSLQPDLAKAVYDDLSWAYRGETPPGFPVAKGNHMSQESLAALGQLAKPAASGKPFFVHIFRLSQGIAAARAGASALAHGIFVDNLATAGGEAELLVKEMQASGTAYIPTLAVAMNRKQARSQMTQLQQNGDDTIFCQPYLQSWQLTSTSTFCFMGYGKA